MPTPTLNEENGPSLTSDPVASWYPSKAEQAMCATKAIELYDQITAMCGEHKGCPSPFDDIYRELLKHRFTLERLRKV